MKHIGITYLDEVCGDNTVPVLFGLRNGGLVSITPHPQSGIPVGEEQ